MQPNRQAAVPHAKMLQASIRRNLRFLWPAEQLQLDAPQREQVAVSRSIEIGQRMGARLPGAAT